MIIMDTSHQKIDYRVAKVAHLGCAGLWVCLVAYLRDSLVTATRVLIKAML